MNITFDVDELVTVELVVNGQKERIRITPGTLLITVLRDELGLTGVKIACGMANCGACTVLRNGVPIYSCITLALDCAATEITTIEGLARGAELHPVQRAFIEQDALQCGFCTPGQVLTMSALLDTNPTPGEDDIRRAMAGNLCRCGAYVKIIKAGLQLAEANGKIKD